jgi:hypothetical protein
MSTPDEARGIARARRQDQLDFFFGLRVTRQLSAVESRGAEEVLIWSTLANDGVERSRDEHGAMI